MREWEPGGRTCLERVSELGLEGFCHTERGSQTQVIGGVEASGGMVGSEQDRGPQAGSVTRVGQGKERGFIQQALGSC